MLASNEGPQHRVHGICALCRCCFMLIGLGSISISRRERKVKTYFAARFIAGLCTSYHVALVESCFDA